MRHSAMANVSRRTRQIGIRRALGASKPAVVRYFLVENSIISAVGLVFGAALSIGLNIAMVEAFSLEPLAWYVIPLGMLALWAVGPCNTERACARRGGDKSLIQKRNTLERLRT